MGRGEWANAREVPSPGAKPWAKMVVSDRVGAQAVRPMVMQRPGTGRADKGVPIPVVEASGLSLTFLGSVKVRRR